MQDDVEYVHLWWHSSTTAANRFIFQFGQSADRLLSPRVYFLFLLFRGSCRISHIDWLRDLEHKLQLTFVQLWSSEWRVYGWLAWHVAGGYTGWRVWCGGIGSRDGTFGTFPHVSFSHYISDSTLACPSHSLL